MTSSVLLLEVQVFSTIVHRYIVGQLCFIYLTAAECIAMVCSNFLPLSVGAKFYLGKLSGNDEEGRVRNVIVDHQLITTFVSGQLKF